MNQRDWHKLISGQRTGLSSLLSLPMGIAACAYLIVIRLRNFLYSKRWLRIHTADVPVISIGNITTGGTGKTPMVIWLCNTINQISNIKYQKCGIAILTRGYKTTRNLKLKTQNYVDEPAIFADSCPQAKVIVNPDRAEAAAEAVNKFGAKALVMDDGFQHRRLARDLDIITIDATCPFGYGKLLPAGMLREPIASIKRAGAAVLTRCDQSDESELSRIEGELRRINPAIIIARSIHKPSCIKSAAGETAVEQLKGRRVFAFCGIGNPDAFLSTIKSTGADIVGSKIYNDHYHYTDADIDEINGRAYCLEADFVLSTQKDYTHYAGRDTRGEIPFAYLAVEIKFTAGEDKLKQLIKGALTGKICEK